MSVQVQLRRDTLAAVLVNHGALGEVFVSTDTHEIFVQDGATNGGFRASGVRAPFGSYFQPAIAESSGAGGETLATGVTTYTTTLQLPAGYKTILGAGWRIETAVTGITTIDFGLPGSPTYFASNQSPVLTAGSTVIYGQLLFRYDAAPVSLLLTSHAGTNFTAGAIRFVVHYILLSPPTS